MHIYMYILRICLYIYIYVLCIHIYIYIYASIQSNKYNNKEIKSAQVHVLREAHGLAARSALDPQG